MSTNQIRSALVLSSFVMLSGPCAHAGGFSQSCGRALVSARSGLAAAASGAKKIAMSYREWLRFTFGLAGTKVNLDPLTKPEPHLRAYFARLEGVADEFVSACEAEGLKVLRSTGHVRTELVANANGGITVSLADPENPVFVTPLGVLPILHVENAVPLTAEGRRALEIKISGIVGMKFRAVPMRTLSPGNRAKHLFSLKSDGSNLRLPRAYPVIDTAGGLRLSEIWNRVRPKGRARVPIGRTIARASIARFGRSLEQARGLTIDWPKLDEMAKLLKLIASNLDSRGRAFSRAREADVLAYMALFGIAAGEVFDDALNKKPGDTPILDMWNEDVSLHLENFFKGKPVDASFEVPMSEDEQKRFEMEIETSALARTTTVVDHTLAATLSSSEVDRLSKIDRGILHSLAPFAKVEGALASDHGDPDKNLVRNHLGLMQSQFIIQRLPKVRPRSIELIEELF